jgi:hypothetical protein
MILPTTMQKCMVDGCDNLAEPDSRGRLRKFCAGHFRFRWKGPKKDIPKVEGQCLVPGCEKPAAYGRYGRTLKCCGEHRFWKETDPRPEKRPTCNVKGCANLAAKDGNGTGLFRKVCDRHHRLALGMMLNRPNSREKFITKVCALCGWEGPCDKHRLIAGKGGGRYVKGNVVSLCPNCHRLVHRGQIEKERIKTAIKKWEE